ncbi:MAG: hypothetical protein NTY08_01580 [Proteobacteria bacterium]|nr:hypothetical protein [Pseudomonadota bacterium]
MPILRTKTGVRSILQTTMAVLLGGSSLPHRANAECMSLISGPVVVEINGCKTIEPESTFDTKKDKYSWVAGLDRAGRTQFFDSYRGLYVKTKVIMSKAVAKGLNPEEGGLAGQTVFMMIAPPTTLTCPAINFKRLTANVKQICCDGSGNVPCLLDTPYLLQQPQLATKGTMSAGKSKAKQSADYMAATSAYNSRKFKAAAKGFEKARVNGELDIVGFYHLGDSYRQLDQCRDALAPLKYVQDQVQQRQVWADEENSARQAIFLLARCYAKMNDPEAATQILSSYLLEPTKYQTELKESLIHKDFGWIHTSREFLDYEKLARQKLKTAGPATP